MSHSVVSPSPALPPAPRIPHRTLHEPFHDEQGQQGQVSEAEPPFALHGFEYHSPVEPLTPPRSPLLGLRSLSFLATDALHPAGGAFIPQSILFSPTPVMFTPVPATTVNNAPTHNSPFTPAHSPASSMQDLDVQVRNAQSNARSSSHLVTILNMRGRGHYRNIEKAASKRVCSEPPSLRTGTAPRTQVVRLFSSTGDITTLRSVVPAMGSANLRSVWHRAEGVGRM